MGRSELKMMCNAYGSLWVLNDQLKSKLLIRLDGEVENTRTIKKKNVFNWILQYQIFQ